jgi:hypothetical protein
VKCERNGLMENKTVEDIELEIESIIGQLYLRYYQLRQLKEYRREYDLMGTLTHMLIEDRQLLREKYREYLEIKE